MVERAWQRRPVGRADPPVGPIALTGCREPAARELHLAGRHLVERQRAGLVRTDLRGAAKRFHQREPLHNRAPPGQPASTHGQRERDHRGQPFRNSHDGERYRTDEQDTELFPAHQAEDEHHGDNDPRDDRERAAQRVDLTLQRAQTALRAVQHVRNATHLGPHARRGDEHFTAAPGDRCVHVDTVHPIAQGGPFVNVDRRRLGHRLRLAGEHRLLDLQGHRLKQPAIGGHPVAGHVGVTAP